MNEVLSMRVKVKPVGGCMIHAEAFEGPCRVGEESSMSPEADRTRGKMLFERFLRRLKPTLIPEAELLEPMWMEWGEDRSIPTSYFDELQTDFGDVDVYLTVVNCAPASSIARRYRKPVVLMFHVPMEEFNAEAVTPARFLSLRGFRASGHEAYVPADFEDLNRLLALMRVRKAVRHTKVLAVWGHLTNKLEDVRAKLGIDHELVPWDEVFAQMDKVTESRSQRQRAEEITDRLMKNAQAVHMSREGILPSVHFYLAAKSLMDHYGCNAFSMPCYEVCATKIPFRRKVTFCLTHSLLKDAGYPSMCEGDINALPTMTLLIYLSRKSTPMGNPWLMDRTGNLCGLQHDVPGLKMQGLDGPGLPYQIRSFTHGGWGPTIRYDFARDQGEPVTLATFNPTYTKLLVASGEIAGCKGFDKVGCTLMPLFKVADAADYFDRAHDFTHHHTMVYGDYAQKLTELGRIMGFEVVSV